jgi:hypothetical protein
MTEDLSACKSNWSLIQIYTVNNRPPQGPGLSVPQLKTDFSQDFQQNLFIKWNRHSSKCNACKFLIKVALWKVKPMKLTLLDSTTIYPINPVIYHPLIALWPAKIKTLDFTFALSSFPTHDVQDILLHISWAHHFTGLTYSYISHKNVSTQWLSLITKTRIRGLDDLNLPHFGNWWQPCKGVI